MPISRERILQVKKEDGTIVPGFSIEWVDGRIRLFRLNDRGESIGSERVRNLKDALDTAEGICSCSRLQPYKWNRS